MYPADSQVNTLEPWERNAYQLVSWWSMEKFSANDFFDIARTLASMRTSFTEPFQFNLSGQIETWMVTKWLPDMELKCRAIGLRVSAELIADTKKYLASGVLRDTPRIAGEIEHISNTIRIEMSQVTFMHIPAEQAKCYDQKELFGTDVNAKFPGIQFDIVEAGNCFASGRGTACVFHLMRIMETGVQEFGNKLGVKLVNEKNWQNILDETNKVVKGLPKSSATVEMSEASANLYAVKLAWRNEVMHPKDTYTMEEADNLIRQVRIFMQQLAKIM